VGIFLNEAAIVRLVGARLLEQNDESAAGRRWLSLETLAAFGHSNQLRLPTVAAWTGSRRKAAASHGKLTGRDHRIHSSTPGRSRRGE
jgi:hypothetical protein